MIELLFFGRSLEFRVSPVANLRKQDHGLFPFLFLNRFEQRVACIGVELNVDFGCHIV
jgi:hypothetical protein